MNGATILLLLGCSVIVIAAKSPPNSPFKGARRSQNLNTNINTNTNIMRESPKSTEEREIREPSPTAEEMLRKVSGLLDPETDPDVMAMSVAAAEAAMMITNALASELSETTALAVAEAIAKLFGGQDEKASRRSYNVNTNTNTNFMGYGPGRMRDPYQDLFDNSVYGLSTGEGRMTLPERSPEMEDFKMRAAKSSGGLRRNRMPRGNMNSNVNNNQFNPYRNPYANRNDEEIDLRSSAYRRSVNRNTNSNTNNYRRSTNSNTNTNSNNYRRSTNSNTNTNSNSNISRRSSANSNANKNNNRIVRRP